MKKLFIIFISIILSAGSISLSAKEPLKVKRFAKFFAIVGMNLIFIYLFVMLGGRQMLTRMAVPFTSRIFSWSNDIVINMVTIIVVAAMVWYISYFLYKRKIFIKL